MALLTNINGKFSVSDAGAVTFNNAFTFPTADGSPNYVLRTDGSGQLNWSPDNNDGDITGSGTANTVTKFTGAKTIGDGPITFSSNDSTFAGSITGTRAFFNSGATNVVATFTSTDGTATLQCADPTGNVEFGASGDNFVVQPAGGTAQLTVGSTASTFAGGVTATHYSSSSTTANIFLGSVITKPGDNLGFVIRNSSNTVIGSFLRISNTTSKLTTDNLALGGTTAQYVRGDGSFATYSPGTGTVTGSGTANTMPVWTSASALGNSIITTGSPAGQATVGGVLNVTGNSNFQGSVDVLGVDDIRVRFLKTATFKAGLQVPTTAGDMITNSAVDDFCIRSQTNTLFATGGATERMRIDSSGNVGIGQTGPSFKLDVNGTGYFSDLLRVDEPVYSYTNSGTKHYTHLATGSLYGSGASAAIITTNIPGHNISGNGNMFSFKIVGYAYGMGVIDMTVGLYAGENNFYSTYWSGTCQENWIGNVYVFTNSAGQTCIQLGEVTDALNCEIAVTDFVQGFGNVNSSYSKGWSITAVTTLPTQNQKTTLNYKTILPDVYEDVTFHNNVGIGTTSPSRELDIQASSGWAEIALRGNTGGGGSLEFWTNTTKRAEIFADTEDIVFRNTASNAERMRIASTGQIVFPRTGQPPITNSLYGNIVLDSNAVTNFQRIRYDVGTTAYWGLTRLNTGNFAITGGSLWNDHAFELQYATQHVQINESIGQRRLNVYDATDAWIRLYCGSAADWIFGSNGSDHSYKWYNQSSNGGVGYKMALATSGALTVSSDVVAYGSPSDKRLKENIKPIESALDKAMKLQGVTFDWKKSDSILKIKEDIGFIAQDVQKVVPELVRENEDGMLSMRHQGIAPILLEAIKELKAEIEELKLNNCNCK
jgi:hypothetical protein